MGKVLKIREVGDPILNKISDEVDIENINEEILEIIEDLKSTLEFGTGLGIAAPQIGINKRIIVVGAKKENIKYNDAEEIPVTAMINPTWKGIDLDGVVIDSETTFRTYEEIFDIDVLKGNNLINKEEPKFQARYNWTNEQEKEFIEKYFLIVSKESNLMSGFIGIYNLLKEQGHEFVVITARGGFVKEMKDDAIRLLEENNIKFDKYYWNVEDKLKICKNEKVDIMIDDDWKIIKRLADNKVKTLYFRDTNLMKLEENEYIKEVNNWGEIYRYIREIQNI